MPKSISFLISILSGSSYYAKRRLVCDEILHLVSNFNIVDTVLCKINLALVETAGDLSDTLTEYLNWILKESEVRLSF